ncbi:copper resistance protein B [Altererythrobacter sp. BO-6]|uniref:copper resistance protein B n=1 Tax=Altererythrobacter sp. BO-6 TaxID=2604537 RepID=UPI0013E17207|nr:copper resistance protein B [Altererythrobacter sp. BO-6]QIG54516.1 copper resistance protein B [Altererythrobacter sp. BO-6]
MRALLFASAALIAAPAAAQDHSAHDHSAHTQQKAQPGREPMDHCAMGHLPPEQCPPKHEHAQHGAIDHSQHGAMDHSQMDHSQHAMPSVDKSAPGAAPESAVPPRALEGPLHAADAIWGADAMAAARAENHRMHGSMATGMVMLERLEARFPAEGGEDGWLWDAQAFYGTDIDKFVLKSEGEGELGGAIEDAEVQALWGHAIGPFFDLQAGLRLDVEPETRSHLVLGVQGLAPYMWHVDMAAFLSDRGDLTARLEGEYDQKITQQLILQPRVELELAAQDIPERGIGAGLTKIEPGLRLRYEFVPEFAPYVGVEYEAKLGETADIARAEGEDPSGFKFLVGLRAWF